MAITYEQLKQKQLELFISDRTKQEEYVTKWMTMYRDLPLTIRSKFNLNENLTLRDLLPELYKDSPDQEIYDQQYNAMVAMFSAINEFARQNQSKNLELLKRAEQELEKKDVFV